MNPAQFVIEWELLLLLAAVSAASGLLFNLLAKRFRLQHVPFWTALGVFMGLIALPFMVFAARQNPLAPPLDPASPPGSTEFSGQEPPPPPQDT